MLIVLIPQFNLISFPCKKKVRAGDGCNCAWDGRSAGPVTREAMGLGNGLRVCLKLCARSLRVETKGNLGQLSWLVWFVRIRGGEWELRGENIKSHLIGNENLSGKGNEN